MSKNILISKLSDKIVTDAKSRDYFVIGISGFGGSGKSTLAKKLVLSLAKTTVIPLDDFILDRLAGRSADWRSFDWSRLINQVLQPIKENKERIEYRQFLERNKIGEIRSVKLEKYIIIEGVGLVRDQLKPYFDYLVWVDVPLEIAISRGKKRDKEVYLAEHDQLWDAIWGPNDKDYFDQFQPKEHSDYILTNE